MHPVLGGNRDHLLIVARPRPFHRRLVVLAFLRLTLAIFTPSRPCSPFRLVVTGLVSR